MPGPNPYLADIFAAFSPGADLAGYGSPTAAPLVSGTPLAPVGPPPNPTGFPSLGDIAPPPPPQPVAPPPMPAGPPPPPPTAGMSTPFEDPNALVSRAPPPVSQGPMPAPPVGVEGAAPAAPPPPRPDAHPFDLQPTMAGGAPAHEVETRGPSVLNAQALRNDVVGGAIGAVAGRNQEASDNELQMALSQERDARLRENAYQQSLAEQEDELQARQADFDDTTRQMSRLGQLDHGRFWASRSTPQKVAGAIEVMLAGFRGGPSMVMKRIDEDLKSQESAYAAARDQANAKQSAFGSAMAKYQNVNAARAAARAASIDVLQAQLSQVAAKNKGNETGNRAILAIADLQNEKMLQIQNGIKFVPAQAGGRYWRNPETGLIYNEKEAHEYDAKRREYVQNERIEGGKVGGQILVQRDKAAIEGGSDGSPMTKEQRGKIAAEQYTAQRASDEFNSQMDTLLTHHAVDRDGITDAYKAKLGGRLAPDATAMVQDIEDINQQVMASAGGVAKDAEGKLTQIARERLEHAYKLEPTDTPARKRQKLEGARNFINTLARQQGAKGAPAPNKVDKSEYPSTAQTYK